MARKNPQSKVKSSHGGRRPGAGRKSKALTKLRADYNQTTTDLIVGWLPELLGNLKKLAGGVLVQTVDPRSGDVDVYSTAPDREANKYLIDRVLGKPTERREVSGPEGGPVPVAVELAAEKVYGRSEPVGP